MPDKIQTSCIYKRCTRWRLNASKLWETTRDRGISVSSTKISLGSRVHTYTYTNDWDSSLYIIYVLGALGVCLWWNTCFWHVWEIEICTLLIVFLENKSFRFLSLCIFSVWILSHTRYTLLFSLYTLIVLHPHYLKRLC